MVPSITNFLNRENEVPTFRYVMLSSADCGRHGEVILHEGWGRILLAVAGVDIKKPGEGLIRIIVLKVAWDKKSPRL